MTHEMAFDDLLTVLRANRDGVLTAVRYAPGVLRKGTPAGTPDAPTHPQIANVKECVMFSVIVSASLIVSLVVPFAQSLIGIGLMCSGGGSHCGG